MTAHRARGAALVLVLWLVVLLTALVGAFALTARVEAMGATVQDDGALAAEHARAGLEYALSRLRGTPARPAWVADGRLYPWTFDGSQVELRLVAESGKVDLNLADRALLAALARAEGAAPAQADRVAGAIVDWRDADDLGQAGAAGEARDYAAAGLPYGPANAPFQSVAEVQRVLGMDAALYARLREDVTVFAGRSRPDPAFAPEAVLAALGVDAQAVLARRREAAMPGSGAPAGAAFDPSGPPLSIRSRARTARGGVAELRAVVRPGGSPAGGAAYTVLRWEEGMAAE